MKDDTKQTRADEGVRPISDAVRTEMNLNDTRPTYWGILCRSCQDLVAFCTFPHLSFGAASLRAGAIRCDNGHNYIYFPRDFHFLRSSVAISGVVMQKNRETYIAINSVPRGFDYSNGLREPEEKSEPNVHPDGLAAGEARAANLLPDARREIAQMAAKDRWAEWAAKKAM